MAIKSTTYKVVTGSLADSGLDIFTTAKLSLSSGVFSILNKNGNTPSAADPVIVRLPLASNLGWKEFKVQAAATFTDDVGTSDIVGEEFGATTGRAWGVARPFFLYAINTDDTDSGVRFGISPTPTHKVTPGASAIAIKGTPSTSSDNTMFVFTSSATGVNGKPCRVVGGIRMTMSTSDDWTVLSLGTTANGDGLRPDPFIGCTFSMAPVQMGANNTTNNYISCTGTEPVWATPASTLYSYQIGLDGECKIAFTTTPAGSCTNGATANAISLALPYKVSSSLYDSGAQRITGFCGVYVATGTASTQNNLVYTMQGGSSLAGLLETDMSTIKNTEFGAAGDDLVIRLSYKAFA